MKPRYPLTQLFLLSTMGLLLSVGNLGFAGNGKGGKPPKDDSPSDLPAIRYSIAVLPIPESARIASWEPRDINNLGMVVGNFTDNPDGSARPFLYSSQQGAVYDLRLETDLSARLDALKPGFRFSRLNAINDAGVIVGLIYNPTTEIVRGIAIDTALNSNEANWQLHLLPDFGPSWTEGGDINIWGDVAGSYERADGTRDRFVFNPFADPPEPGFVLGLADGALAYPVNINDAK